MRIGVIHHSDDVSNDYAAYLSSLLDDTAIENGYEVKDYEQLLRFRDPLQGENVLFHIVLPAAGRFSIKFWYNTKLAKIAKKYALDKLICQYGICSSSLVPQLMLLPDKELFNQNKKPLLWEEYAAKYLKKNIQKATSIITYSNAIKGDLQSADLNEQKFFLLPYTVGELFQPMEWHDKLYIKSRFAENKEYFVAVLPDNDEKNFTDLLKAFSKFKKWQQSNMLLLLLPKEESFSSAIDNKLDLYKYRSDVKLINDADSKETANIIATAYALVHYSLKDADLWPVAAAIQVNTPVISFYRESIYEYCNEASLLVKDPGHEAFGDALISVYKDEALRTKMSESASERAKLFKQKEYAGKLWQLLNQA